MSPLLERYTSCHILGLAICPAKSTRILAPRYKLISFASDPDKGGIGGGAIEFEYAQVGIKYSR